MVEVINRGVFVFLLIVLMVFGSILFFKNISLTSFAVAQPDAIYVLKDGGNTINTNVNADGVIIEGLSGEVVRRGDIYALYTNEISANNLNLIELYKRSGRLRGQIISSVDNNIAVVNGKSYTINMNENLVVECAEGVCLNCIKCQFNRPRL